MKGKIGVAFIAISLIIFLVPGNCLNIQGEKISLQQNNMNMNLDVSNLTNHTRIDIRCDEDFGPTGYNFSGTGTVPDPYRIENFFINTTFGYFGGIYIENVSKNFIIKNCVIEGWPYFGIKYQDIDSSICTIENNTIYIDDHDEYYGSGGIVISTTNDVIIKNNRIIGNSYVGLHTWRCNNLEIYNNSIYATFACCDLYDSSGFTFEKNNFTGYYIGIDSQACNCFDVLNNTFTDLYLSIILGGNKWEIKFNKFYDIRKYGVDIGYGVEENVIHHNWFFGSENSTSTSLSYDNGDGNYFYDPLTKEGNYWSDWKGWGKYEIRSNEDVYDLYPLTIDFLREDTYPAWLYILPIFGGLVGIGFVTIIIRFIYKKVDSPAK